MNSEDITRHVLRLCIDLAFERKGALFLLPENKTQVHELVTDHETPETNITLRKALRGIEIGQWDKRQVVAAAAGTDGATIIDDCGKLVDIAVMLRTPPENAAIQHGFDKLKTFPGARTTAAWNASLYGVAIKVSEDGPITVWRRGKEEARLG